MSFKPAYFPFDGQPYKPQMGVKPLDLANWIEIDEDFGAHLAKKRRLLSGPERSTVLAFDHAHDDPGRIVAASLELNATLRRHLGAQHAKTHKLEGERLTVLATDESFGVPSDAPEAFEQVSRWIQEDVCLLSPKPPVRLVAALVCFPSRWSLLEKMGKASEGIHQPVPKFQATIGTQTQNFLERLQPGRGMWRLNWTIHDSDELYCPGPVHAKYDFDAETVLDNVFLRMERQTLSRLPESGFVAFTIRTYVYPLAKVVADPERKRLLGESLRHLPEEDAVYKGMKLFFPLLKRIL